MDPILLILSVTIGGIMIGAGVHFMPVGGAPAAMATATGVGTGTAMLATGAGLTGLVTAASMAGQPLYIIMIAGAIGAMMMMGITMFCANIIYVFGIGVVPVASKTEVDPITGRSQPEYKTAGTEGHGVPTICFVSGIIGGFLGGAGGGLIYYAVDLSAKASTFDFAIGDIIGIAAMFSLAVLFVNAVIASYNIGGTTEGIHDPKFKRIGTGMLACGIASVLLGIFAVFVLGGI